MDGFVGKEQMMYISIRKYKLISQDAKTRGELTRQINDLFLPEISKAPGSCRTMRSMAVVELWPR